MPTPESVALGPSFWPENGVAVHLPFSPLPLSKDPGSGFPDRIRVFHLVGILRGKFLD